MKRDVLANVLAPPAETWPQLRLSLDTAADLALLRRVFDALHEPAAGPLPIATVIHWLRGHPEVVALNADVEQKPTLGRIL